MSEYVSKEELKEFFESIEVTVAGRTRAEAISEVLQAIYIGVMELPTTDAVQVIRCKDCIHNVANRETDPLDTADYSGIDIVCDYFMTDGQEPDDYCSQAERLPQVNPEMVKALKDRIEKQRGEDAKRKS